MCRISSRTFEKDTKKSLARLEASVHNWLLMPLRHATVALAKAKQVHKAHFEVRAVRPTGQNKSY